MVHYRYLPLGDETDTIRIFELNPGSNDDPLAGELIHSSLFNLSVPHYEALPYCWGDPSKVATVETPDGDLRITASLHSALQEIRARAPQDTYLLLWVDAICINQNDEKEKATQVPRMKDMYSRALKVIVWLGPEADDSLRAAQLIDYLRRFDPDDREQVKRAMPAPNDPGWKALCALLRRPWFTRLWVVQEVVSNDKVLVMWGDCSASWDLFQRCLLSIFNWDNIHVQGCDNPQTWQATAQGWTSLHRIQVLKRRPPNKKGFLLGLLYHLRMFRASNPRDHLFAVLGLAEDGHSSHFKPDYIEPMASILLRYATNYVKSGGGFHLLRYASWGAHCEIFPSWIPDWVSHQSTMPIPLTWEFNAEQGSPLKYHAAGSTSGAIGFIRDAPPGLLSVKGSIIDTVASVGVPYHLLHPPMPDGDHNDECKAACFASAEHLIANLSDYPTGEDLEDVLFRTLIANSADDATLEDGPGKITRDSFDAFRRYHRQHQHQHQHQIQRQRERQPQPDSQSQSQSRSQVPSQNLALSPVVNEPQSLVPSPSTEKPSATNGTTLKQYDGQFVLRLRNRLPILTSRGYFGIVPDSARIGDRIAVFLGCPLPFILRSSEICDFKACASGGFENGEGDGTEGARGDGGGWDEESVRGRLFRVVGHAYVHRVMKGEMVGREEWKEEWLHLH